MDYIEIQGEKLPAIGLGTWKMTGKECRKAVLNALETGYRHIDTAQAYGNEQDIGTAIKNSSVDREDIWLTTKIWRTNLQPDDLVKSFHNSLEKLQTDHVDLLLIHWPNPEVPLEDTLEAMESLVQESRVKNIGLSNFTASQIEHAWEVSGEPIFTDQVEYHPFLNQDEILKKCIERDMVMTAYSPLARGDVLDNEVLKEISSRYGKSPAQIALRWLIQEENIAAIPKAASPEHQEANIDVFDFQLTDQEIGEIDKLAGDRRKIDPDFAPEWD